MIKDSFEGEFSFNEAATSVFIKICQKIRVRLVIDLRQNSVNKIKTR